MKISYEPVPFFSSTLIDGKPFDFAAVKANKKITVDVSKHSGTKTRLNVTMRNGEKTLGANFIPPGSEKFKFHLEMRQGIFSDGATECAYFVTSKKQGITALEAHLKNCVKKMFDAGNDFEITIRSSEVIRELQASREAVIEDIAPTQEHKTKLF